MDRARFIEHQGRRILHIDLSETRPEASIEIISRARELVTQEAPGSVLTLTDVSDVVFDTASTQALEALAKHNKAYVRAAAVIGVTGIRKVLYHSIVMVTRRKFQIFDTMEAALDWLSSVPPGPDATPQGEAVPSVT